MEQTHAKAPCKMQAPGVVTLGITAQPLANNKAADVSHYVYIRNCNQVDVGEPIVRRAWTERGLQETTRLQNRATADVDKHKSRGGILLSSPSVSRHHGQSSAPRRPGRAADAQQHALVLAPRPVSEAVGPPHNRGPPVDGRCRHHRQRNHGDVCRPAAGRGREGRGHAGRSGGVLGRDRACKSSPLCASLSSPDGPQPQNGGHCQPGIWDSVPEVARFELATFNLIKDLVAEHQIPCDWQVVGGVHAIFSQEVLGAARKQLERLRRHPDLGHEAVLIQDRAELAARHVPEALAAVYQPNAAKCWPYKLVAWLLERLIGENDAAAFNLQTNTPVEHLERRGSRWSVHTRRGRMLAQDVMLATNGYTSRLLPKMTELILPVRGQVCALETPRGGTQLPHSYVWMKGADHQYLIHRGPEDSQPDNGGEALDSCLILGGERLAVPDGEEGISRDDELNPVLSRALRAGLEHVVKLLPGNEPEIKALPAAYEWTGIMGYSRDCSPWVGRVPATLMGDVDAQGGAGGLWISAGYTGHGMPVAARCGIAVADMILGRAGGVEVPEPWRLSDDRVERARGGRFPNTIEELLAMLPAE